MTLLPLFAEMPVPRDLPLPLPLEATVLKVMLVLSFLLHIFFVNLMVGGALLVVVLEIMGLRKPRLDAVAHAIAQTVTVNKSMAVVLGIGPLLCINLVYTIQWYSANTLTGHAWILIIPAVSAAFLLTYLHKYTWGHWNKGDAKILHIGIGCLAATFFLFIPLVFLANVNLMLYPTEWEKVHGFFSSLIIGNVFPRYFHFLLACIALTGLFLAGWLGRQKADLSELPGFTHTELRRIFYWIAFFPTVTQFVAGPILLFTLPTVGLSWPMYGFILAGAALGFLVVFLLALEVQAPDARIGRYYIPICTIFSIIVLCMGTGRHLFRETALADQNAKIQKRTAEFEAELKDFNAQVANGMPVAASGKELFANCAACHAADHTLTGPSLIEISQIYHGNPDGIVSWAEAPGKKRPSMPQMPSMASLGAANLRKIADYMLDTGAAAASHAR